MSRFFQGNDSSSESSSEEEELYSDGEEEEDQSEEESSEEEEDESEEEESSSDDGGKTGINRFLKDLSDEEESEEEDRVTVVKSQKDKRYEELEGTVRLIENAQKINDWAVISSGRLKVFLVKMYFTNFRYPRVRQAQSPGNRDNEAKRWQSP